MYGKGGLGSPRRWRTLIRLDCDAAAGLLVAEAQVAADRRELALVNTVPVGAILRRGALELVGAGRRRCRQGVSLSRFVMDTARLFCRKGARVGGAAEGTSAEGKSVEKPNRKGVGEGLFSTLVMAGHTQPLARVLMHNYAIIPKQLS